MLVDLQQQSHVECDMNAVVGSEGKDNGLGGVGEEMTILQTSPC